MRAITKHTLALLLLMAVTTALYGQSPKSEMRAIWLATVWGLDWPNWDIDRIPKVNTTGNAEQIKAQKDKLIQIFDNLAATRVNAVYMQVRSRCDAMYKSSYEPWSTDLVQTRGMDPGYDPLAFAVQEAHKRGMELHAWINPYRFESVAGQWSGLAGDYSTTHPEWVLRYADFSILDPGNPEVRSRITDIVGEIVSNYDIDGIVFDDYFYKEGIANEDQMSQDLYNTQKLPVADWRRENVNKLISSVYNRIQDHKPYATFGIGPPGIWDGSEVAAAQYGVKKPQGMASGYMYHKMFCDPLAWLERGIIDYISPQIYWTTGSGTTDYNVLAPWWAQVAARFGRHFYSSQTISGLVAASSYNSARKIRLNNEELSCGALSSLEFASVQDMIGVSARAVAAFGPEEIGLQIQKNRASDLNGAPGSVFYSGRKFYSTPGFMDYLKQYQFTHKALVPAINWKSDGLTDPLVTNIKLNGRTLFWDHCGEQLRYSVYAFPTALASDPTLLFSSTYLQGFSYTNQFELSEQLVGSDYSYAVAVYDRYGNEYAPMIMGASLGESSAVTLSYPEDNAVVDYQPDFSFNWSAVPTALTYYLEIATDPSFDHLVVSRAVRVPTLDASTLGILNKSEVYYWRVRTRCVNAVDAVSEVRELTVFNIKEPLNGNNEMELTPTISWMPLAEGTTYKVEIASDVFFSDTRIVYAQTHAIHSIVLPQGILVGGAKYCIRVTALHADKQIVSPVVYVKTLELAPAVPTITFPVNESTVSDDKLEVRWLENPNATSFRVELCPSETFPSRQIKPQTINSFVYTTTYEGLTSGSYYLRVRAYSTSTTTPYTEWSDVVMVHYSAGSGIVSNTANKQWLIWLLPNGDHRLETAEVSLSQEVRVQLYATCGVLIDEYRLDVDRRVGSSEFTLPTAQLPSGSYLFVLSTGEGKEIFKFIK